MVRGTTRSTSLRKRVREFCKAQLSSYKIPVKVEIVSEAMHNARFKRARNKMGENAKT